MTEEFKIIPDFPDYEINKLGDVRCIKTNIVKNYKNKKIICLKKNKKFYERLLKNILRITFFNMEGFKIIPGFPKYAVNKEGAIVNIKNKNYLKRKNNKSQIIKNNKTCKININKLVNSIFKKW